LKLWAQATVDELETAIANGWCDCEDDEEECMEQCSNAAGWTEEYGGSYTVTDCRNCNGGCPETCTPENQDWVEGLGAEAVGLIGDWASAWGEYCGLKEKVEELEEELDDLKDQLSTLQQAKASACADGPSPACTAAEEKVNAKQQEIDAKEKEIEEKKEERDKKKTEAGNYLKQADRKAIESVSAADSLGEITATYSSHITGDGTWADTECDKLGPDCFGKDPTRCSVRWIIMRRTTSVNPKTGYTYTGQWGTVLSGGFTPNGLPYVTYIRGCGGVPKYACASYGPRACENGCGMHYTYEVRSHTGYPRTHAEICCQ
jgi:hypothetical protein